MAESGLECEPSSRGTLAARRMDLDGWEGTKDPGFLREPGGSSDSRKERADASHKFLLLQAPALEGKWNGLRAGAGGTSRGRLVCRIPLL